VFFVSFQGVFLVVVIGGFVFFLLFPLGNV
jgi:hypothetical protein